MKTYSDYMWLKRQLAEMTEVLSENLDSPLMRASLENRIESLKAELDTMEEMEYIVEHVPKVVARLRDMSPVWDELERGVKPHLI